MASKAAATSRAQRPYEWQALAGDDVRILTLLPGRFDDELRIQIAHTQLPTAATSTGTRMTRKDLEGTLPSGWTVYESLDGRYLFVEWLDKTEQTLQSCSWTHPDPDIDSSLYEPAVYEAPGPQNHAFEALSYVWGSEDDPGLAFVQTSAGISTRTISIGRNLESALRHLRYGDKPRKLWVDAICINQTDDDEKSVQVRRMSRIYQSAYRVVAWIGPKADGSDVAMSTLEYLGFQVVAALDGMGFGSPDAQEEDWQMPTTELPTVGKSGMHYTIYWTASGLNGAGWCKKSFLGTVWQLYVAADAKSLGRAFGLLSNACVARLHSRNVCEMLWLTWILSLSLSVVTQVLCRGSWSIIRAVYVPIRWIAFMRCWALCPPNSPQGLRLITQRRR